MARSGQLQNHIATTHLRVVTLAFMFALVILEARPATAQTLTVLHNFTGGEDGGSPLVGLGVGASSTFYGAAASGGGHQSGTVFTLRKSGSGWVLMPLYGFEGIPDGDTPGALVIGRDGTLYGSTYGGGNPGCLGSGCGTAFKLRPPPAVCQSVICPWIETVLYRFVGGNDAANPNLDKFALDAGGSLYGTTHAYGAYGQGSVFKLTLTNGAWAESLLYSFTGGSDGAAPEAGVVFDVAGNLYGTTVEGGSYNFGTVYELTPSGSAWTEHTLYSFRGGSDGAYPQGGLIFDSSGNIYGTSSGTSENPGTVFRLTPPGNGWTYSLLHSFVGSDGADPQAALLMDASKNLYGTTTEGGSVGVGVVFELSPSGGGWTYSLLHDFSGNGDGGFPYGDLVIDESGSLYGTTSEGGSHGKGVIFDITNEP